MKKRIIKIVVIISSFFLGMYIILYPLIKNLSTVYMNKVALLQLDNSNYSYIIYKILSNPQKLTGVFIGAFITCIIIAILLSISNRK